MGAGMSETNAPETAHDRYLRCLREAEEAMECADETGNWGDVETEYWKDRANTWALLAQSAATMCLAEATAKEQAE